MEGKYPVVDAAPDIALDIKHVIYSVEVQPEVVQQYTKLFGGPDIITPSKQLIL